jgi:hypothetical protein
MMTRRVEATEADGVSVLGGTGLVYPFPEAAVVLCTGDPSEPADEVLGGCSGTLSDPYQ